MYMGMPNNIMISYFNFNYVISLHYGVNKDDMEVFYQQIFATLNAKSHNIIHLLSLVPL